MKKVEKNVKTKKVSKSKKSATKEIVEPKEVEETEEVNEPIEEEKPKKKKKRHIGLKIFISLLVIFIVFPIAFVFIAFYDTSTKKNLPISYSNYQNTVAQAIRKGLSNAKSGSISLSLGETELDGVLLYACDQISAGNKMVDEFLDRMYCEINENKYNFYVDLHASFFVTRLTLETELIEEEIENDVVLNFNIKGIKVGRLPLPINLLTTILGKFITNEKIESAFKNTGFNIHCDLANAKITYKRSDFQENVGVLLSSFANDNNYIQILLELMGEKDIINIDFKDAVSASFNLVPLHENDVYNKTHYFTFTQLDEFKDVVIECLNKNSSLESNSSNIFTYLIRGKNSNSNIKNFITGNTDTVEDVVQKYTGKAVEEYEGAFVNEGKTIRFSDRCVKDVQQLIGEEVFWATNQEITDFVTNPGITTLNLFRLKDNAINLYLPSVDNVIGKTILSTSFDSDRNTWDVCYIVVDNLYSEIKKYNDENKLILYLGLNINGYETTMVIPTTIDENLYGLDSTHIGNVKLNIDKEGTSKKLYYGEKLIPSYMQDTLLAEMPKNGSFNYDQDSFLFNIDDACTLDTNTKNLICNLISSPTYEQYKKINIENNELQIVIEKPPIISNYFC